MSGNKAEVFPCPECGSRRVGRIATNLFYCSDCCVELNLRREQKKIEVFQVDEEGNLVAAGSYGFEQLDRPPLS